MIDLGGLDVSRPRGGQFRYVIDLILGLHELQSAALFIVLGGGREPVGELTPVFAYSNSPWKYRHFPRRGHWGTMYLEQLQLAWILLRERASLYHGLHTVVPIFAFCPLVATVYDLMYELFPEYGVAVRSRPYRLFRWSVKKRVRRAICISQTTADDVASLWRVPSKMLAVTYLGTTFASLNSSFIELPGITSEMVVVLSPYNLEPRKNLAALVRAFATIDLPHTKMVLYGRAAVSPEREHEFDALVEELGLGSAILRTGYLSDGELRWLLSRASVFVFPSLYEGFGYPVLEALASGTCVVTRRASAMAEIVGPAGVLVETGNPEEIATAVAQLLADPSERVRLRRLGRLRAEQFSVKRMAEETFAVYQAVLQN